MVLAIAMETVFPLFLGVVFGILALISLKEVLEPKTRKVS
tara:strand:+ start:366 stop:485 length:120 start_codon:yes stop_codon:yes gene_type:complete